MPDPRWPWPDSPDKVDEELRFHLDMREADYARQGLSTEEAQKAALERFGDYARVERECRALDARHMAVERRTEWLAGLSQDIRFAFRNLRRRRGFAAVALLTLALGIGAVTAVFGVMQAVLIRPLPFANADRIVVLWNSTRTPVIPRFSLSGPELRDLSERVRAVRGLSGFSDWSANLTGNGEPARVQGYAVSPGFFQTLGVSMSLGRGFATGEGRSGSEHVVVLSHALWSTRFGADSGLLGRSIQINGQAFTVVGVAPGGMRFPEAASFLFPEPADLWVPRDWAAEPDEQRGARVLRIIGRLSEGATPRSAQQDLADAAIALRHQSPDWYSAQSGWRPILVPLREQIVGEVRLSLLILAGAVAFVLLISCATIANLLLAQAGVREQEMAVRLALGAGRGRLVRQLLTESVVLAIGGGALGLGLGAVGMAAARAYGPRSIPGVEAVRADGLTAIFVLVLALFTAGLFGVAPALQQARGSLFRALRSGGRGMIGGGRTGLRRGLVMAELGLSLTVLSGAGLLVRSVKRLTHTELGISGSGVLAAQITLPLRAYADSGRQREFFRALLERVMAEPGVVAVGAADPLPFSGDGWSGSFRVSWGETVRGEEAPVAEYSVVSPGFFSVLGLSLRAGRVLSAQDDEHAPKVVVIDSVLAQRYWPRESPLEREILVAGGSGVSWTARVVGVVGHVRRSGARDDSNPQIYLPFLQAPRERMYLAIRGTGDPLELLPGLRRAVHELDPLQPVAKVRRLEELADQATARDRFSLFGMGVFAALATLLAAVGLYGVMAYGVAQRSREIGMRLALGATPRAVVAMVIREGMATVLLGLAAGLTASLLLSRVMGKLLYETGTLDPLSYLSATGLLLLVSLAACYLPATQAAKIDPLRSIRAVS